MLVMQLFGKQPDYIEAITVSLMRKQAYKPQLYERQDYHIGTTPVLTSVLLIQ